MALRTKFASLKESQAALKDALNGLAAATQKGSVQDVVNASSMVRTIAGEVRRRAEELDAEVKLSAKKQLEGLS